MILDLRNVYRQEEECEQGEGEGAGTGEDLAKQANTIGESPNDL